MHMLAFGKKHLHQVAFHTGLHGYVGNGDNRAQFGQFHGHTAGVHCLYRYRLALAGISRAVVRFVACLRAQEGKAQNTGGHHGTTRQKQALFGGTRLGGEAEGGELSSMRCAVR